jgi:hypothetical protein
MSRWIALTIVVVAACASSQPMPARTVAGAPDISVPDDGSRLLFAGKATGVQIYVCAAKPDGGFEWKLRAPDAEVVNESNEKLRHYAGPTWEAADGSKVVGEVKAKAQVDAATIPWLLLGAKANAGSGLLTHARWIQRLDTKGGKAPDAGCTSKDTENVESRVPYTAVYRIWGD